MLLLAAASLAASPLPAVEAGPRPAAVSASATAQAVVRLMAAETIRFGAGSGTADPRLRTVTLRLGDGEHEAKIVEFE